MNRAWRAGEALLVLLTLVVLWRVQQAGLLQASAVPWSDESAHLNKLLDLREALARTRGWEQHLALALFSNDAYPSPSYAATLPFLGVTPTLNEARSAFGAWIVAVVGLGLWVGRTPWGAAGAWAWSLTVGFAPAGLALARIYYLDVPLMATVAAGFLFCEASEGFSRSRYAGALALVACLGMYTKWTWAIFLVMPLGLAVLRGVYASAGAWARRIPIGLGLLGWAGAVAGGVAYAGMQDPGRPGFRGPLAVAGAGIALWCVWMGLAEWRARRARALTPAWNVAALVTVVGLVAGPWYALVWGALQDRYAHEHASWVGRNGVSQLAPSLEAARLLVPACEVLIPLGILLVLVRRRGGWTLAGALGGALFAFWVTVRTLPFDPRYLLPLLPLLAGAIVAGLQGLAGPGRVAVLALVASVDLGCVLIPAAGRAPVGTALVARRWHGVSLPGLQAVPTPWIPDAELDRLLGSLAARCGEGPCTVHFQQSGQVPLQARALTVLTRLRGWNMHVDERAGAGDVQVIGWCPRMAVGEGCYWTPALAMGCRIAVCGQKTD